MDGEGISSGSCCSTCYLEVEVNGQGTFMVDQVVLASFSRRFARLFGAKSMRKAGKSKVIFHCFPGGAEGFELMSIFCYNNGKVSITPQNIVLLKTVANFMEMDSETSCTIPNLVHQTENSLGGISYWSWSELVSALKQCQDLLTWADSSVMAWKIMESLVDRLGLPNMATSCTSSSDSSSHRFSNDTRSTESRRPDWSGSRSWWWWWFEDLVSLNIDWVKRIVISMLSREFDHAMIARFLVHYQQSRSVGATLVEKLQIIESVIDLLSLLDQSSLSWKPLFEVFRVGSRSNIGRSHRVLLERLMASKLDQATSDHLLFPSPNRRNYAYDIDLILRIAWEFLSDGNLSSSPDRLKKVGHLVDSFLVEVSPDLGLMPCKFKSLITVLPETARDSHDLLYHSIDMYLKVHNHLSEEQKLGICSVLSYEKLSADALKHLAKNTNFPADFRANTMRLLTGSSCFNSKARKDSRAASNRLRGLRSRILELDKLYKVMQTQMANLVKPQKTSSQSSDSYLPRLCSS